MKLDYEEGYYKLGWARFQEDTDEGRLIKRLRVLQEAATSVFQTWSTKGGLYDDDEDRRAIGADMVPLGKILHALSEEVPILPEHKDWTAIDVAVQVEALTKAVHWLMKQKREEK